MTTGLGIALSGLLLTIISISALIIRNLKRNKLPECIVEFGNIKESLKQGRGKFQELYNRNNKTDNDVTELKTDVKHIKKSLDRIEKPLIKIIKNNDN